LTTITVIIWQLFLILKRWLAYHWYLLQSSIESHPTKTTATMTLFHILQQYLRKRYELVDLLIEKYDEQTAINCYLLHCCQSTCIFLSLRRTEKTQFMESRSMWSMSWKLRLWSLNLGMSVEFEQCFHKTLQECKYQKIFGVHMKHLPFHCLDITFIGLKTSQSNHITWISGIGISRNVFKCGIAIKLPSISCEYKINQS
jgi:hypothetical protein